jgi:DNA-binding transcriptional ArsR family regulator
MAKNEIVCDCDAIHAEAVEYVKKTMPDEEKLYDLSDFFKVLGDSTRVKIICALDCGEMCVCDLAVLLNMTKSAISHQLASLKQADLVKYRREGKNVYYSLADDHVKEIFEKGLEHIKEDKS